MSEMIERVAKAIWGDGAAYDLDMDAAIELARVAIEAMREPTNKMQAAGYLEVSSSHPEQANLTAGTELAAWRAMIDEALR